MYVNKRIKCIENYFFFFPIGGDVQLVHLFSSKSHVVQPSYNM